MDKAMERPKKKMGRPLTAGVPRKQRQTRATDEEWELIKAFDKLVKRDREKAKKLLKEVE